MKFAALFGLAAFAAAAVSTTVPAFASEDDEPAHVSRDWKSGGGGTASRGSAPNQRGSTRTNTTRTDTVTRDTSHDHDDEPKVTYARPSRNADSDDGDHGRHNYRNGHRRHYEHGGLDRDEAARIRNAHRESDRRVTLDRDHHDYGVPSYSSYGHRRHNWWSFWW
jgi:hypothetical protein